MLFCQMNDMNSWASLLLCIGCCANIWTAGPLQAILQMHHPIHPQHCVPLSQFGIDGFEYVKSGCSLHKVQLLPLWWDHLE
jgi:hypothetical protein